MVKYKFKLMKIFVSILFLILSIQSWTKADNIKDFEIEGMTVGESLLNYLDETLIKKEINNKEISYYYENKFVSISLWEVRSNFQIYDDVGVILKQNDKNYEIFALEGTLYMAEDATVNECHEKQKKISQDIQESFSENIEPEIWFADKDTLRAHLSSIKYMDFLLSGGGLIRIVCYDVIPGVRKNSDLDLLYVAIDSPQFLEYLNNR